MSRIDQYLHAATRENTRRSYHSAIQHYEVTWGGFLPATANNLAEYLAHYAEQLTYNTLKQRSAALAQWHIEQGFPDPTKAPVVRKVLKGIRELHPYKEKRARPLQLETLAKVVAYLDEAIERAREGAAPSVIKLYRDKALLLLGFWRGFRSDELCRLAVDYIDALPNTGMTVYLPRSKGDRQTSGRTFFTPALDRFCPTQAYLDWLLIAKIQAGPVFRSINRWGTLSQKPLHPNSIIPILRSLFAKASIEMPESYSSHSLRRGFASWAADNHWDLKALMDYVGWQDPKSALAYLEKNASRDRFLLSPPMAH